MMTAMETSLKAKLRTIAKEQQHNPADLWQILVLERFLVRLSRSRHSQHFILKGGVLLSKYISIGRETVDLDFLAINKNKQASLFKIVFDEIAIIDLSDGFTFGDINVSELIHPHMPYNGIEVAMMAYFGRVRLRVSVDIGFGDIVKPIHKELGLTRYSKGPLFEEHVSLLCYPQEFIFAEKLETAVYRGALNSRMKDFHDLYSMISSSSLSLDGLENIIQSVFRHRQTVLNLPLLFTTDQVLTLQAHWNRYLQNLQKNHMQDLPKDITRVIHTLNDWLSNCLGISKQK